MRLSRLFCALTTLASAPLAAQAGLPGLSLPPLDRLAPSVIQPVETIAEIAARLARERVQSLDRLVRHESALIERDARGNPARRGELLVMDLDPAALALAQTAGFALLGSERIAELDLNVTRLRTPAGRDLADGEALLKRLLPAAVVSADSLHFPSGVVGRGVSTPVAAQHAQSAVTSVGVIDGAPGRVAKVAALRGFARGAPLASNHGSAVVSLLASAGARTIRVADVYGADKAGGNAFAIAQALGWLVGEGSKVVTISLVGPHNPVLERAVTAARRRGVVIVAAVGNDGPAAPPAYPASYPGVLAVTAVDGKRRALIEAGRALHLDYAAPGADIRGFDAKGKSVALRGTSFAAPLVAARAAKALASGPGWRRTLDAEALDLGKKGRDDVYGAGLLCGDCRGR
jgi:subtilisin family serine protease